MRNEGLDGLVRVDLEQPGGLEHGDDGLRHSLRHSCRGGQVERVGFATFLYISGERRSDLIELTRARATLIQEEFVNVPIDAVV